MSACLVWPVGGASVPQKPRDVSFNCGDKEKCSVELCVLILLIVPVVGFSFSIENVSTKSCVVCIQSAHALLPRTGTGANGGDQIVG